MVFRITLVQGLNRQIRRMCKHFGFEVTKLERVRIMNVSLKGLPPGEWRDFTDDELIELFRLIEHSSSLDPAENKGKPKGKPAAKKMAQHKNLRTNRQLNLQPVSVLLSRAERKRTLISPVTRGADCPRG